MEEKTVVILGATGSIGTQACEVIERLGGFRLVGFSFGGRSDVAERLIAKFGSLPYFSHRGLRLQDGVAVGSVEDLLSRTNPDIVLCAVPGFEGVLSTLTALKYTRRVALATKEALVCAAPFVKTAARERKVELIPVDSEHSALFQIIEPSVTRVVITASGGAVRDVPLERLTGLTPREVLKHPTWSMGKRITVDSSTMVNKFFEVIEAHELFELPLSSIEVALNPSSFVHAIVFLSDGAIKIHAGRPDMRIPIAYALTYPNRAYEAEPTHFTEFDVSLRPIERERYPLFFFGLQHVAGDLALRVAFNAADEVAVEWFLGEKIPFGAIQRVVTTVVETFGRERVHVSSVDDLIEIDKAARRRALEISDSISKGGEIRCS